MKICSIVDCGTKHYGQGYCSKHYQRWKRHGDPLAGNRRYATPEEAFAARTEWRGDCLIWTGARDSGGYGHLRVGNQLVGAHRYAWERENGPIPEGMLVDHKDHCSNACVNVGHLRLATIGQNNTNLSGVRINNSSGFRNVYYNTQHRKWSVIVQVKGNLNFYGYFDTAEEANAVAIEKRKELFGEFAGKG